MKISDYWDPWNDQIYLKSFEREVQEILKEDWVTEEIECGMTMDSILDNIWKTYEDWAFEEKYNDINPEW